MEKIIKGRTNWLKTILITLGIVCLVALVGSQLYRRMGPLPVLSDRDIAGATAITSQWLEIATNPVLKASTNAKTPLVILKLEGDYTPDLDSHKLRYPDGTFGVPDVQLVDERGTVYALHFLMVQHRDRTGSNAMGGAGFGAFDLPVDGSYVKVRIRSDKPMKCTKIIWRR